MAARAEHPGRVVDWVPRPWVVRRTRRETEDTVSLEIEAGEGVSVEPVAPGQFLMLYAFGVGEVPISVASVPSQRRLVHTVRAVGAVTRALCALTPGQVLGVRGPFGSRWPLKELEGRDVVLAAGGLGMAPLRPVVEQVLARREAFGKAILLYGAREPGGLLYPDELAGWRAAGLQVEVTVDSADRSWSGHVGVVTTLIRYARFDAGRAAAFLCGPEVMMRFMGRELIERGVAPERTFLSMERNMRCAVGLCGHCQLGPEFVCMDGPVLPWPRVERLMEVAQL